MGARGLQQEKHVGGHTTIEGVESWCWQIMT